MTGALVRVLVLAAVAVVATTATASGHARVCCERGQACWPDAAALAALSEALDPTAPRSVVWDGQGTPLPLSFPFLADQPLFGAGRTLAPLDIQVPEAGDNDCMVAPADRTRFCQLSARNNPMLGWTPALIAWPLTDAHVQTLVGFALDHDLCVCVAGTGHDFLNRHSCTPHNGGLLIRTALLKEISWANEDARGPAGTVRLGAGVVFHEAHAAAATQGRAVASGWSPTVGVAGWTLGGGHGPFNPSLGLGADQLVEATVVVGDGSLVTARADGTRVQARDGTVRVSNETELLRALRGGGGSTWGVVTTFTVKAHPLPTGGYTKAKLQWEGVQCIANGNNHTLNALIEGYMAWSLTLDSRWGGLAWADPTYRGDTDPACPVSWYFFADYWFSGAPTDPAFTATWAELRALAPNPVEDTVTAYPTVWAAYSQYGPERIYTINFLDPSPASLGGLPSVLVSRAQVASGRATTVIQGRLAQCARAQQCWRQELYNDLTGQLGSPQDAFTALNPGMRSALFHYLSAGWSAEGFAEPYTLGAHSYFGESAYDMPDWPVRYWGEGNHARLLAVKQAYDPDGLFWCRHCVGDTSA
jgi:ribonuclease T2